ncbi:MAG TPA: hypothetical protein VIZ28_20330 [Chitinophagaceae bacterium]
MIALISMVTYQSVNEVFEDILRNSYTDRCITFSFYVTLMITDNIPPKAEKLGT